MKVSTKLFMGLGLAALIVAAFAPVAHAQCAPAREVAMALNGQTKGRIGVDMVNDGIGPQSELTTLNNQTEVAIFWEANLPSNNSGGPHVGTTSTCPSATGNGGNPWWRLGGAGSAGDPTVPGARSIQFFIGSTGCTMPICPADGGSLAVVVEDVTEAGDDACFIMYVADETPGPVRYYDLARTDPASQPSSDVTHACYALPRVDVQASSGPPPTTNLTNLYRDITVNFWGVGPKGTESQMISSYDIYWAHGPIKPGRARNDPGWTFLQSVGYTPGGTPDTVVSVPCPTTTDDTYLAVGVTYDGAIPSYYLGKETAVECDPSIADPDGPSHIRRPRPNLPRKVGRR